MILQVLNSTVLLQEDQELLCTCDMYIVRGLNWQFIQIFQYTTGAELYYSSTGSMYINSGKHHNRKKVEEKFYVTFLLCDPG